MSAMNNAFGVHSGDVQDIAVSLSSQHWYRLPVSNYISTEAAAVQLKTLDPWVPDP